MSRERQDSCNATYECECNYMLKWFYLLGEKVNKSFKNKYELDFTNLNHENEVQIDLQEENSSWKQGTRDWASNPHW